MKRFFKVRLLPVCLLLVMLFRSLPVFAEGERVYHLDTAYASERLAYGTVEPIDTGAAFTSHSYYDQLESDLQRTIYEAVCNTLPGDPAFTLETSEIPTFILPAEGPTQAFQQQVMDFIASQVLPAYAATGEIVEITCHKIKCNLVGVIENMVEMSQYETYMDNYDYYTLIAEASDAEPAGQEELPLS